MRRRGAAHLADGTGLIDRSLLPTPRRGRIALAKRTVPTGQIGFQLREIGVSPAGTTVDAARPSFRECLVSSSLCKCQADPLGTQSGGKRSRRFCFLGVGQLVRGLVEVAQQPLTHDLVQANGPRQLGRHFVLRKSGQQLERLAQRVDAVGAGRRIAKRLISQTASQLVPDVQVERRQLGDRELALAAIPRRSPTLAKFGRDCFVEFAQLGNGGAERVARRVESVGRADAQFGIFAD